MTLEITSDRDRDFEDEIELDDLTVDTAPVDFEIDDSSLA